MCVAIAVAILPLPYRSVAVALLLPLLTPLPFLRCLLLPCRCSPLHVAVPSGSVAGSSPAVAVRVGHRAKPEAPPLSSPLPTHSATASSFKRCPSPPLATLRPASTPPSGSAPGPSPSLPSRRPHRPLSSPQITTSSFMCATLPRFASRISVCISAGSASAKRALVYILQFAGRGALPGTPPSVHPRPPLVQPPPAAQTGPQLHAPSPSVSTPHAPQARVRSHSQTQKREPKNPRQVFAPASYLSLALPE